ncbi:WG repeat-containing protein [Catenulispora sp. GP43]|uniref:WG repeat-containing protein n=1 Tax=Catenulispora sp. GP43 TaxID=3156263 RepID=UPI0035153356
MLLAREGRLIGPALRDLGVWTSDGSGGLIVPAVDLSERWGYLDHEGRWLRGPEFDRAQSFSTDGLARVFKEGAWSYLDLAGRTVLETGFSVAGPFSEGLAAVGLEEGEHGFGYIDRCGQVVIEGRFASAEPFCHGLALVQDPRSNKYGFINAAGEYVIEPGFTRAHPFDESSGQAAPVEKDGAWGLIDRDGRWVLAPSHVWIKPFTQEGIAHFMSRSHDEGYLDVHGTEVIQPQSNDGEHFDVSEAASCGLVLVTGRAMTGHCYFTAQGEQAFPDLELEWAGDFHPCGGAIVLAEGEWSVLRRDGRVSPLAHWEPVSDDDGWIPGFDGHRGLAPFIGDGGGTVLVDANGADVCRIEVDRDGSRLSLLLPDGTSIGSWEQDPDEDGRPAFTKPKPLFSSGPDEHFHLIEAWKGGVVGLARGLEAGEPGPFLPASLVSWEERDPYDLDEDDLAKALAGAIHILASSYIKEELWGEYLFLEDHYIDAYDRYFTVLRGELSAHYGEPLSKPPRRHGLRSSEGGGLAAWQVGERTLYLQQHCNYGDGDFEHQLWLALVQEESAEPRAGDGSSSPSEVS